MRDTLLGLFYPGIPDWSAAVGDARRSLGERAALLALDPRNITLEPEYYADVDPARFARVKPLLWLWYSFDRSPLAGQNVALGVAFRRRLAPRIFARCGRNFKCFQHVEFSYGYNIEAGDDVVIHRHVLLDDRGGLTLGDRVSVSDYANIYSHTHSIVDQRDVTNARTILEDDVRITYHATVLAGVRVGRNGMVGRQRGGDEGRPPLPRERRHPGQVRPGQAERPARGDAHRPDRPPSGRRGVGLNGLIVAVLVAGAAALVWSWRERRRLCERRARPGRTAGAAPAGTGRLCPAPGPPHQRDLLPPGTQLHPLRVAPAGADRGAGGALHGPVPRGRWCAGRARVRGAPRAPGGGRRGDPLRAQGAPHPARPGRDPHPGHRPGADRTRRWSTAWHRADRRRPDAEGGGRAASGARHDARRARRGHPGRPPVLHPGPLAHFHGRDAGGRGADQQPVLRTAPPGQGRVGDDIRRPLRGDRPRGHGRPGDARQPRALRAGHRSRSLPSWGGSSSRRCSRRRRSPRR